MVDGTEQALAFADSKARPFTPTHVSHKEVEAYPLRSLMLQHETGVLIALVEASEGLRQISVPFNITARGEPPAGSLLVRYAPDEAHPNGYLSFSPRAAFEDGYSPIRPAEHRKSYEGGGRGLTFGQAIEQLKAGDRVARDGWNGVQISGFIPLTREPVIFDGLCHILLDSGAVAICDAEDIDLVRIPRKDGSGWKEWYADGAGYPSITHYENGEQKNERLHQRLVGSGQDHANGDILDNRRRNLRDASSAENAANRASVTGSSSRFKGVTWDKSRGKWMAACNGRTIGRFEEEIMAARAYDRAARASYGRFARLNFPEPRMWLALSAGTPALPAEKFWSPHNRAFAEANGGSATVLPCITMRTATGEILMGWLASQTDMLAEDWCVV